MQNSTVFQVHTTSVHAPLVTKINNRQCHKKKKKKKKFSLFSEEYDSSLRGTDLPPPYSTLSVPWCAPVTLWTSASKHYSEANMADASNHSSNLCSPPLAIPRGNVLVQQLTSLCVLQEEREANYYSWPDIQPRKKIIYVPGVHQFPTSILLIKKYSFDFTPGRLVCDSYKT